VLTLEGGWQRAYKASFGDFLVNKQIEGAFLRENPEMSREYNKQYREKHKEKIEVRNKQYREEHKDEKRAYDKQYREEHKDEKRARDNQYYQERKEKINAKRRERWTCKWCTRTVSFGGRTQHKKICKLKPNVHDGQNSV
jgi:uncharacterized protein YaiL (DUF2058 family)